MNTIRLWLPQLFAIVEEYFTLNKFSSGNATLCDMLEMRIGPKPINGTTDNLEELCIPVSKNNFSFITI
jgi:hypothetical protein